MMSAHGCVGRLFSFFPKFDIGWIRCWVNSFLQQKASNHSFKIVVSYIIRGEKSLEGWVKIDTKIRNVEQNIGLILVFNVWKCA
jgi:hypothetical protein